MRITDLDTPCLVLDADRLDANIRRMADACARAGVALRPHAKTHKSPDLARLQIRAGAVGLTCAKVSEAEVFAAAGLCDLLVAYPLLPAKARRLRALADRFPVRLATIADSEPVVRSLADAWHRCPTPLNVLVAVDVGYGRLGLWWENERSLVALARRIADTPSLHLAGVLTHAGHAYDAKDPADLRRIALEEGTRALHAASTIADALDLASLTVSVGSTPSARDAITVSGVTEARPGTYIFNDGTMAALGVCSMDDCALTVCTNVVSVPAGGRAVCDAGSKAIAPERLHNALVLDHHANTLPGVRLARLSEEHGWLTGPGCDALAVGRTLRIIPGHVCPCVNLARHIHLLRGDEVIDRYPVPAAGAVS